MGLACSVAVLMGVLQFNLWFDSAVGSGRCDQGVFDQSVVPIDGRLGRLGRL